MGKKRLGPISYDESRVNFIRGKSLVIGGEIGEDIRELCFMLDWFEQQLDQLDYDDELGTEGWRHRFGLND